MEIPIERFLERIAANFARLEANNKLSNLLLPEQFKRNSTLATGPQILAQIRILVHIAESGKLSQLDVETLKEFLERLAEPAKNLGESVEGFMQALEELRQKSELLLAGKKVLPKTLDGLAVQ